MRKYITILYEDYTIMNNNKKSKLTKDSTKDDSAVGDYHTEGVDDHTDPRFPSASEISTAEPSVLQLGQRHPSSLLHQDGAYQKSQNLNTSNQEGKGKVLGKVSRSVSSSEISDHSTLPVSSSQHHKTSHTSVPQDASPDHSLDESTQEEVEVHTGPSQHSTCHHPHTPRRRWKRPVDKKSSFSPVLVEQGTKQGNRPGLTTSDQNDHQVGQKELYGENLADHTLSDHLDKTTSQRGLKTVLGEETSHEEQGANLETGPSKKALYPVSSAQQSSGEWGSLWNVTGDISEVVQPRIKKKKRHVEDPDLLMSNVPLSSHQLTLPHLTYSNQDPEHPQVEGAVQTARLDPVQFQSPDPSHHKRVGNQADLHASVSYEPEPAQTQWVNQPVVKSTDHTADQDISPLKPKHVPQLPPPGVPPEKTKRTNKFREENISKRITDEKKSGKTITTDSSLHLRHNTRPKRSNAGKHSEVWRGAWKS